MTVWRTDVIGSLLRPAYLKTARVRRDEGVLDAPAFKRVEDPAVDEALALQAGAGLDVVTDMCMEEFAYARGRTDRTLKVTLINAQPGSAW